MNRKIWPRQLYEGKKEFYANALRHSRRQK